MAARRCTPSEVISATRPALDSIGASLPPGYKLEIAGEHEKQTDNFGKLSDVAGDVGDRDLFCAHVSNSRTLSRPFIVFARVAHHGRAVRVHGVSGSH